MWNGISSSKRRRWGTGGRVGEEKAYMIHPRCSLPVLGSENAIVSCLFLLTLVSILISVHTEGMANN